MTSGDDNQDSFSVSVPIGAAVAGVLLVGAAAAYLLMNQNGEESSSGSDATQPARSFIRRMGILGLVTMIENDATRKVVVAVLKAMARRA